jgi:hypothetical protein
MLPNFMIIGCQKCGTTTMFHHLAHHPDIFLPRIKESKFFIHDHAYSKGLSFYERAYFSEWNGENAAGEADPDYIFVDHCIGRIAQSLNIASMKFIMLVRNPIERAFSHFLMTYRRGYERLSFDEALALEHERVKTDLDSKLRFSYMSRGFYFSQITRLLSYIDTNQLLLLFTEELNSRPHQVLREVFRFLGVDASFLPPGIGQVYHRARVPRSAAFQRRLRQETLEKRLMRLFLPSKPLRERILLALLKWNQKPTSHLGITDSAAERLAKVFSEENAQLANFARRDLTHWSECNSGR